METEYESRDFGAWNSKQANQYGVLLSGLANSMYRRAGSALRCVLGLSAGASLHVRKKSFYQEHRRRQDVVNASRYKRYSHGRQRRRAGLHGQRQDDNDVFQQPSVAVF